MIGTLCLNALMDGSLQTSVITGILAFNWWLATYTALWRVGINKPLIKADICRLTRPTIRYVTDNECAQKCREANRLLFSRMCEHTWQTCAFIYLSNYLSIYLFVSIFTDLFMYVFKSDHTDLYETVKHTHAHTHDGYTYKGNITISTRKWNGYGPIS